MSIDDKLGPISRALGPISRALGPIGRAYHRIDDEVHRYFEKVVKRSEDEGSLSRRQLHLGAYASQLPIMISQRAIMDTAYPLAGLQKHSVCVISALTFLPFFLSSAVLNIHASKGGDPTGYKQTDGALQIENLLIHQWYRFARGTRLSYLIAGCGLAMAGGVKLVQGLTEKDAAETYQGSYLLMESWLYLSNVFSVYLMDQQPKLLERDPAWKRALSGVRGLFAPEPTPVPVRVDR